ncbi:MAG: exodeoxyribonuclease VII small subunit [Phycisphaerae bacterium]|nr:exodeoxyribonuclease VII small subunit [Phycisphaerae bacterium]
MAKKQEDIGKLSFEEAIRSLTDIVGRIESGQTSLDESLGQYEKGMALIKHCRTILQAAEKKIDKIAAESGLDREGPQAVEKGEPEEEDEEVEKGDAGKQPEEGEEGEEGEEDGLF